MLTADQERDYRTLKDEYNESDRYKTWERRLLNLMLVMLVIFFFLFAIDNYIVKTTIIFQITVFTFMISTLTFYGLALLLRRLAERNLPSADKLVLFHTYSTIHNLDCYYNKKIADTIELKSKYRSKAIASAKALLSAIKEYWVVGDFEFGQKVLGGTLSRFKENVEKRLVPNIESGDPETLLKRANEILWGFAALLRSPATPEDLALISGNMSQDLPLIEAERKSIFSIGANFVRSHAIVKDAIAVLIITGFCIFVAILGMTYFTIPSEYVWTAFWTLWGVLFVGYLNYLRKKKE